MWWCLSLLAQTASAEDASSLAASVLFSVNLTARPQMTLLPLLSQFGDLMSRKLLRSSVKAVQFPHLGSFSCRDVSLCILHNTAVSPFPPPTSQANQTAEWQGEANSRTASFFLLDLY